MYVITVGLSIGITSVFSTHCRCKYKTINGLFVETAGVGPSIDIEKHGVSRLEKRSDFLNSTLRSYIETMGGQLSPVAAFPDREPVILSGIAAMESEQPMPLRRRRS
jgi:hypothetical protein